MRDLLPVTKVAFTSSYDGLHALFAERVWPQVVLLNVGRGAADPWDESVLRV